MFYEPLQAFAALLATLSEMHAFLGVASEEDTEEEVEAAAAAKIYTISDEGAGVAPFAVVDCSPEAFGVEIIGEGAGPLASRGSLLLQLVGEIDVDTDGVSESGVAHYTAVGLIVAAVLESVHGTGINVPAFTRAKLKNGPFLLNDKWVEVNEEDGLKGRYWMSTWEFDWEMGA